MRIVTLLLITLFLVVFPVGATLGTWNSNPVYIGSTYTFTNYSNFNRLGGYNNPDYLQFHDFGNSEGGSYTITLQNIEDYKTNFGYYPPYIRHVGYGVSWSFSNSNFPLPNADFTISNWTGYCPEIISVKDNSQNATSWYYSIWHNEILDSAQSFSVKPELFNVSLPSFGFWAIMEDVSNDIGEDTYQQSIYCYPEFQNQTYYPPINATNMTPFINISIIPLNISPTLVSLPIEMNRTYVKGYLHNISAGFDEYTDIVDTSLSYFNNIIFGVIRIALDPLSVVFQLLNDTVGTVTGLILYYSVNFFFIIYTLGQCISSLPLKIQNIVTLILSADLIMYIFNMWRSS